MSESAMLLSIRKLSTRFYYGPLTRLAQALISGEDDSTFNADRSDVLQEGVVKVHLCSEVGSCPDPSAPSAGRAATVTNATTA